MGNSSSCFTIKPTWPPQTKVIFHGSITKRSKTFTINTPAAELMLTNPDKVICHADSFFIGRPIPMLSIEDSLLLGETYFVLPINFFPCNAKLTTATLASKMPKEMKTMTSSAFEYVKGEDGTMLIRVLPEFIMKMINDDDGAGHDYEESDAICTTPELKKQYELLVKRRDSSQWSPKLDTIKEKKEWVRVTPVRLLGLGL